MSIIIAIEANNAKVVVQMTLSKLIIVHSNSYIITLVWAWKYKTSIIHCSQ